MFDQSFSAENYLTIFQEESRKGHIAFDTMSEPYRDIVVEIKAKKSAANEDSKQIFTIDTSQWEYFYAI